MKQNKCERCGTALIVSENKQTAFCPTCKVNANVEIENKSEHIKESSFHEIKADGIQQKKQSDHLMVGFGPSVIEETVGKHGVIKKISDGKNQSAISLDFGGFLSPQNEILWRELIIKTNNLQDYPLNLKETMEFAKSTFESMTDLERAKTVPIWRVYLKEWAKQNQEMIRPVLKDVLALETKQKKILVKNLEVLTENIEAQTRAGLLSQEEYQKAMESKLLQRNSAKQKAIQWFWFATLFLFLFFLFRFFTTTFSGFFFIGLVFISSFISLFAIATGFSFNFYEKLKKCSVDISNLVAGNPENMTNHKSHEVIAKAQADVVQEELKLCIAKEEAAKTLLSVRSNHLEKALFEIALDQSGIEYASKSQKLVQALKVIGESPHKEDSEKDEVSLLRVKEVKI